MQKRVLENLLLGIFTSVFLTAAPVTFSQTTFPERLPTPARAAVALPPAAAVFGSETTERSLKVDPTINLTVCVTEGTVKVNSWKRDELRVFVQDGSKFGFKVSQKSETTGDPVWVNIVGTGDKGRFSVQTDCIRGGDIEIDLPAKATVNFKGRATNTTVDGVRKANVRTAGGDISLRNIAEGVVASTYQGDITVEASKGTFSLESATGNIVVFEVGPSEPGDTFRAKTTSGLISIQKLEHRQIEVNSISGSVAYSGAIRGGGSYTLTTSIGSIRLAIPPTSAFTLSATYGYGRFETDLPLEIETENISEGPIKTIVGKLSGGGDAIIRLESNNGSIAIKKQ